MKYLLVPILFLLVLLPEPVKAQRCFPGQFGIQLSGGTVDAYFGQTDKSPAFFTGVHVISYTRKGSYWMAGIEFLEKRYAYQDTRIPKAQFTAEGGYCYNFFSDRSKTVMLSIGGSLLLGYESSNWNQKLLFDGATLQNKDCFIYGAAGTLAIEVYITDYLTLSLNARQRLLFGSSIGRLHNQLGLSLKFLIH